MTSRTLGFHYAALAFAVFATAASHVALRLGANAGRSSRQWRAATLTLVGYGLFLAVTVAMIVALQKIPLSEAAAWSSASVALTMLAARVVLRERFGARVAAGSVFIVLGAVVIFLSS